MSSQLNEPARRVVGRVYKSFEDLIDPFQQRDDDMPPKDLVPYLVTMLKPFGVWLPIMAAVSMMGAVVEVSLLFYTGRLIDLLSETGVAAFWASHGAELIVVALLVLLLRPMVIGLAHLFLEQALASNMQEQVRWRAHKHMLGQSMGFFQNDFAGRLANRVMQQGPAVEDSTYMLFEAMWFALVYVISAGILIAGFDLWLVVPLALWLIAYALYTWRLARRVAVASEKMSDSRSMVTGRVVDAYTNMETVKLFADEAQEEGYVRSAMRRQRLRFQRFLRLMTELSLVLNLMNGLMICGIIGLAVYLWIGGAITIGEVAAASALVMRLNGMSGWIMWVTIRLFEHMGVIREGLRSIAVKHDVVDAPDARKLKVRDGGMAAGTKLVRTHDELDVFGASLTLA